MALSSDGHLGHALFCEVEDGLLVLHLLLLDLRQLHIREEILLIFDRLLPYIVMAIYSYGLDSYGHIQLWPR